MPMIKMFGHRTLGGGVSEPGKIAQISISCASDLVSLTPSLNVNICVDLLSPDFGQIQRWAVREMGLEDYTWKISEAALHGEFGLVCPCIFNCSRLYLRSRFRVCIAHGGIFPR